MAEKRSNAVPKAPCARILMNAGAKRVSADAVNTFSELLQDKALKIAEQAVRIAKHSGRKTVHDGDIKISAKV